MTAWRLDTRPVLLHSFQCPSQPEITVPPGCQASFAVRIVRTDSAPKELARGAYVSAARLDDEGDKTLPNRAPGRICSSVGQLGERQRLDGKTKRRAAYPTGPGGVETKGLYQEPRFSHIKTKSNSARSDAKRYCWPVRCRQNLDAVPWSTQPHVFQATIKREASSSGAVTIESCPASMVVNDQVLSSLIRLWVETTKA